MWSRAARAATPALPALKGCEVRVFQSKTGLILVLFGVKK
jgi:hypothetical protein